jgi:DNA polymerase-3 subunit delta'
MENWNIIGHEWAVQLLAGHMARNNLRHAYLICGPQGVGRRTLGIRLAQAINCPQPSRPGQPCLSSRTCLQTEQQTHPDLSVVQAEMPGAALKVDAIRQLQHTLSLSPYQASHRVALLLRFEEATPSAANALLKTLEEPPLQVVLILTAESPEGLLPTIVSRCEVLRLRPLPRQQVQEALVSHWGLPSDEAHLLAHISGGRPGYALYLHQHPQAMGQRRTWLDEQQRLLCAGRVERFQFAEQIAKDKSLFHQAIQVWTSFWRDLLIHAVGATAPAENPDLAAEIAELSARIPLPAIRKVIANLERTRRLLEQNVNTRLAAEVLFLDMPRL